MKAQEFRQMFASGVETTLPDGLEVRLRPVDSQIILGGNHPEPIMQIINEHMLGQKVGPDEPEPTEREKFEKLLVFGRVLAQNAIVWPRLVDHETENPDEFQMGMMSTVNLMWFPKIINLPLVKLIPFCAAQNRLMELVLRGESELPDADADGGDQKDGLQPDAGEQAAADQPVVDRLPDEQRRDEIRSLFGKSDQSDGQKGQAALDVEAVASPEWR